MAALMYLVILITTLLLLAYLYSPEIGNQEEDIAKSILLWTDPHRCPLEFLGHGYEAFTTNECEYTNCYVSHKVSDLGSAAHYDAIVFNGRELPSPFKLPRYRLPTQKYVYANTESSQNYPICDSRFNGFFNWTWTYRLDSDSHWGYITVYDLSGQVVGPKKDMHWPKMDPINKETKARLRSKNIAAAWFASNCITKSGRELFVKDFEKELHSHGLMLHIYGGCGRHVCLRDTQDKCDQILEKVYYFYFALENSLSEDYVTEKVLTALNHYTVPVVFGGANYSRFLPPGSYLDARELGTRRLAARMAAIIDNHRKGDGSLYHDFFRWRNHYVFNKTMDTEDVCKICKLLNDPTVTSVYDNIQEWWNGDDAGAECFKDIRARREEFEYKVRDWEIATI